MAEAADHPAAPPADEAPRAYSSVSLVAIAGFTAAVLYSAVVVVGGLIALFNHSPFLLPAWLFVVPAIAVVICLAAKVRILNSEGALSGKGLSTAGVVVSMVAAALYAAYYAGTYIPVASQAQAFTDRWLDLIKQDKVYEAFLMTTPPPHASAGDPELRGRLEVDYDREAGAGVGQLTAFRQSDLVRQFEEGGPNARVEFVGVQDWEYDKSAYQVHLAYRVYTAAMMSNVVFLAVGVDGADDSGVRQWYIKETSRTGAPVLTDEGRRMTALAGSARAFAQRWVAEVIGWKWDQAYLDTLPPSERVAQEKEPHGEAFVKGLEAFRAGGVVRADATTFWAPAKERNLKIALTRGLFGSGGEIPDSITLGTATPYYRHEGDQVQFGFDTTIRITAQSTMIQARLLVAADAGEHDPAPDDWRVETLDLISAKSLPADPHRPKDPMVAPQH